jgi:ankyrin repeat protein
MLTALEVAAIKGHTDVIKMLIKAGANVNYQNNKVTQLATFLLDCL